MIEQEIRRHKVSGQFDSCPICKKPMTCSETLLLAGNVWQHYDCSLESSGEMKAATEPAAHLPFEARGEEMSERKPWFPSNGTEGDFVQEKFCDNCENDKNQDCKIIAKALFHTRPGEKIKEWTAIDIYGRGFQCDNFRPKQGEKK